MDRPVHDAVLPNLIFGWLWFLGGTLSGLALGLFFQREDWLGGYASRPRRLLRLGHISFFGLGLLNLAYAVTIRLFFPAPPPGAGPLLVLAGITMPAACAAQAWTPKAHAFFALPVGALLFGLSLILFQFLL